MPISSEKLSGNFSIRFPIFPETSRDDYPRFLQYGLPAETIAGSGGCVNAAGHLAKVQDIVDELMGRAEEMCEAETLYKEGKLLKRVTHCDTKVNKMLFDENDRFLTDYLNGDAYYKINSPKHNYQLTLEQ